MGLNPLPDMELYWSSDPFYYNKEIAQVFPIIRFKKITENLHLNDNEMEPPRGSSEYDKLYKLRPLLTVLNKVYQREAFNSEVQSIDECMVKFKGRSSLKQYMPKKKDLPDIIKKKQPKPLRLEKHQFAAVTAEPITAIKWLDTKEVAILTTAHQPLDTMLVKRTQKDGSRADILCPKAIASYTLSMGGVDLFDHFRSSFPISLPNRKNREQKYNVPPVE
ncbi:piggyBac transposable element-derived protein 4-like [Battus philenor]|uniref:piggyBac transposable element-derived protein 4-like n=1 Tax=Battus philenor TaxID=42288 RepID=UPI0035CEB0A4